MTCPTCGCERHTVARSWQVTCTVCGEERWPTAVARPTTYVCVGCQATPPAVRASRTAAAQKRTAHRRPPAGG
jgi:hypothetical protein